MAYGVSCEPDTLDGIAHETQACARQLLGHADVALHVHEGDRQEGAVFLQAAHHALLALGREQEALGTDGRNGGDGAFYLFFGD